MKYDQSNIMHANLNDILHFKIRIVSASTRRGSKLLYDGRPNCSGYNINQYVTDGMTVGEYQYVIAQHFNPRDPQYSLTKHLKYDVEKGYFELEG